MKAKKPKKLRQIKYNKYLIWLRPYTDAVKDLVPTERLKEVKLTLFRKQMPNYHAICARLNNNKDYEIIVRCRKVSDRNFPMSYVDQETILSSYAHELTHLKIFEDGIEERFVLETEIYKRFGEVLMARGYEHKLNKTTPTKKKLKRKKSK